MILGGKIRERRRTLFPILGITKFDESILLVPDYSKIFSLLFTELLHRLLFPSKFYIFKGP